MTKFEKKLNEFFGDGYNPLPVKDFTNRFGLRFKQVIDSCRNELELNSAENYVRNGLSSYVVNLTPEFEDEYVRILIFPKRAQLESVI